MGPRHPPRGQPAHAQPDAPASRRGHDASPPHLSCRPIQCKHSATHRSAAAANLGCPAGRCFGGHSASPDATSAGASSWDAGRGCRGCCCCTRWQQPPGLHCPALRLSPVSQGPQEPGRPQLAPAALQAREDPRRDDAQPAGEGPPDLHQAPREVGAALRRAGRVQAPASALQGPRQRSRESPAGAVGQRHPARVQEAPVRAEESAHRRARPEAARHRLRVRRPHDELGAEVRGAVRVQGPARALQRAVDLQGEPAPLHLGQAAAGGSLPALPSREEGRHVR
mmetsp:Transcript_18450/g.43739  ORF Transcript_18450/g.43739 Transcript_18450/m.43739 type:complete len:282 (-) Transcript_18450:259-1104(-)